MIPSSLAKIALGIGLAISVVTLISIAISGFDGGDVVTLGLGVALSILSFFILRNINSGRRQQ